MQGLSPGRRAEVDGGLAAQITQRRNRQVRAKILHPPATGSTFGAVLKRGQTPVQADLPGRQRRRLIAVQRLSSPSGFIDEAQVNGRLFPGQRIEGRQRRFAPVAAPTLGQPVRDHRLRAQLVEKISPLPVSPAEDGVDHAAITAGGAGVEQVHRGGYGRVGWGFQQQQVGQTEPQHRLHKGRHAAAPTLQHLGHQMEQWAVVAHGRPRQPPGEGPVTRRQALGLPVEGLVQRQTGCWHGLERTRGGKTRVVDASFCLGSRRARRAGRAFS